MGGGLDVELSKVLLRKKKKVPKRAALSLRELAIKLVRFVHSRPLK